MKCQVLVKNIIYIVLTGVFFLVLISEDSSAKPVSSYTYTPKQYYLMKLAYEEGSKVGYPKTIQAILWQESHAGKYGLIGNDKNPFGKKSYCAMQIKLDTAKDTLKYMNKPWKGFDEELLVKLLTNDRFCMMIGANYFKMQQDKFKNWRKATLAYNQGPGGVNARRDPNDYVFKIRMLIQTRVKEFNKEVSHHD